MTLLKLALTSLFWAALLFLGKVALSGMSPASVSAWRFLLASAVLLPLIHKRVGMDWRGLCRHWLVLTVMSIIGIVMFNLALFEGLKQTSTVNAALIMGLCPIMIAILSAALTGEGIRHATGIGLLVSLSGAVLVITGCSREKLMDMSFHNGDLNVLIAAGCWAVYSALPRRFMPELAPQQITTATVSLGAIFIASYAALTQQDFMVWPSLSVAASIIAMSLFGTVLVFLWWNEGVQKIGPQRAAPFMNVVPLFAMLIGFALGEDITIAQVMGGLLVVAGVGLGLQSSRKEMT